VPRATALRANESRQFNVLSQPPPLLEQYPQMEFTSVSVVLFVAFVLILGVDMARQAACPNIENAEI
jgi:hypothetical protein